MTRTKQLTTGFLTCLATILGIAPISGCAPPELPYLMPISEFTFSGFWEDVLEMTGAAGNITGIQSYDVHFSDDKVDYVSASFDTRDEAGNAMYFSIATDRDGALQWVKNDLDGELDGYTPYDPSAVFAELDRYGIDAIRAGSIKSRVRIERHTGGQYYDRAHMYRLDDGEIRPIRDITFDSDELWVEIWIPRYYSHKDNAPFFIGSLKGMGDYWFIKDDLAKAASVTFARNEQGAEFVDFVTGIHAALPEGWAMTLGTREGYMDPPSGLDEPLFRINFEDTENEFTIPGTPDGIRFTPNLRLYFYDIDEKDEIMAIIESQQVYSWDIPQYYDEGGDYLAVTSPLYINSGRFEEEAMELYRPLDEALRSFFAEAQN